MRNVFTVQDHIPVITMICPLLLHFFGLLTSRIIIMTIKIAVT